MALSITATTAALDRLRTVKFGAYSSAYDVTAPEQGQSKDNDAVIYLPFDDKTWFNTVKRQVANVPYRFYSHNGSMIYLVIPRFTARQSYDLIKTGTVGYSHGPYGPPRAIGLAATISFTTGKFAAFTGPFMRNDDVLARVASSKPLKDGQVAWDYRAGGLDARYLNISYKKNSPLPGEPRKFAIQQGEIKTYPDVTGLGGLVPMIANGKWYVGDNRNDENDRNHESFPRDYAKTLNDETRRNRENGIEVDAYLIRNLGSGRTLVAYNAAEDMLIAAVYAQQKGSGPRPGFFYSTLQSAFWLNGFEAAFCDGSSSVFLYDNNAPWGGRWLIDSLLELSPEALVKSQFWLTLANKVSTN